MTVRALNRAKVMLPIVLLILAFALPPAVEAGGLVHVVRPGENLTRIAARYGTTVQAIVIANRLPNANYIYVGQRLIIPTGSSEWGWRGGCPCVHVVRRGQNLSMIARWYGTSAWVLAQMNGIRNPNYIWAGQRLCVPCGGWWVPSCRLIHWVRRGETLSSIAWRYGTCVQNIVAANHIRNPNLIYAGQPLCIP